MGRGKRIRSMISSEAYVEIIALKVIEVDLVP